MNSIWATDYNRETYSENKITPTINSLLQSVRGYTSNDRGIGKTVLGNVSDIGLTTMMDPSGPNYYSSNYLQTNRINK